MTSLSDRGTRQAWLLALIAFVGYLPSLAGVFQFDDYNVIVNYPTVHAWSTLFERLGGGVRPLLKASYTLNWTLGPGELGFHLVNIALHALNAALLYLIGRELCVRWFGETEAARCRGAVIVATLVFALHPLATEAVTYISGRSSSMMASFYLGALLVYLRGGHWLVSGSLFILAAATRETAVTLPAALLLVELCGRERPHWRAILRRQGAHWTLLAAGGLVILFERHYFELISYGFTRRGLADNLLTQLDAVSYLIAGLLGLRGANIDPALPATSAWNATLAVQAALFAALAAMGLANLRSRPWIGFGLLWFFVQLAPTNSIVPRLDVANDRQLYLAAWGLVFALAVQTVRLELPRRLVRAAAAMLVGVLALASVARQLDYRSEIALWEADLARAPWNARAHNNLGYAYYLAGRKDEAWREFRAALLCDPGYLKARANLLLLD